MLAVMSEQSPDTTRDVTQDFLTTGRAGRRNALPDILGEHALTSTSDLPERLKNLTTAEISKDEDVDMEKGESTMQMQSNSGQPMDCKPSTSNNKNEKKS